MTKALKQVSRRFVWFPLCAILVGLFAHIGRAQTADLPPARTRRHVLHRLWCELAYLHDLRLNPNAWCGHRTGLPPSHRDMRLGHIVRAVLAGDSRSAGHARHQRVITRQHGSDDGRGIARGANHHHETERRRVLSDHRRHHGDST